MRTAGPARVRRRSPAPILTIAAVILLLVICWVFGRGCGGDKEAREAEKLREYTKAANKLIDRSAAVASKFQTIKGEIEKMSRDDISKELNLMIQESGLIEKDLGKITVPEKAKSLNPLLDIALELRSAGLAKYRAALIDALDRKDSNAAAQQMSDGLMDLVVSDEVMQRYRAILEQKLKAAKVAFEKVADSIFIQKQDEAMLASVREYVSGLLGEETGSAIHGVAVTSLSTTPASVDRTPSGISILPYSTNFTVKVTVENQGNQEEEDIAVVVALTPEEEPPKQETHKIKRLEAGESTTLVFEKLKPVVGLEKENVVSVKAGPVPKEKKVDNNEKRFRFVMKPQE